jgi:protoheme IX farnesyltransferase
VFAVAGFLLASKGQKFDWGLFVAMVAGLSLVIAAACVFNNYLDRDIDFKMQRTKKRALVSGQISGQAALIYGTVLGFAGATILATWTNYLTWALALFGLFAYVVLYGWAKRATVHGTVIGSISGAIPPVVGYTAVTGKIDITAVLLFITIAAWQMPHFYAIAIYRLKEYKNAGIPVLPRVKGIHATKVQIILYILAFLLASIALGLWGRAGHFYLVIAVLLGGIWLGVGLQGFKGTDDIRWARQMFFFSLIVTLAWSAAVSIDGILG